VPDAGGGERGETVGRVASGGGAGREGRRRWRWKQRRQANENGPACNRPRDQSMQRALRAVAGLAYNRHVQSLRSGSSEIIHLISTSPRAVLSGCAKISRRYRRNNSKPGMHSQIREMSITPDCSCERKGGEDEEERAILSVGCCWAILPMAAVSTSPALAQEEGKHPCPLSTLTITLLGLRRSRHPTSLRKSQTSGDRPGHSDMGSNTLKFGMAPAISMSTT